eukprot:TRINITY_DN9385_c0_g1_i3.p1 TRINITY_DN9385_c0_g1~~TRINITY_DN9385_c0_g1_i3.p1  ORF type:complete len:519 (-),score=111.86 TRINITY_DN9385_c0_g1_i3:319-1875(-)
MVADNFAATRTGAVEICQELVRNDVLHHVCDDHPFEDSGNFYRFTLAESFKERLSRRKQPSELRLQALVDQIEELRDCDTTDLRELCDLYESTQVPPPESDNLFDESPAGPEDDDKGDKFVFPECNPISPPTVIIVPDPTPIETLADKLSNIWVWAVVAIVPLLRRDPWLGLALLLVFGLLNTVASQRAKAVRQAAYANDQAASAARTQAEVHKPLAAATPKEAHKASAPATAMTAAPATVMTAAPATAMTAPAWAKPHSPGKIHQSQRLKVFVFGGNRSNLIPVDVNDDRNPVEVGGPRFVGRMVVRVLGLQPSTDYFNGKSRRFSIQIQGVFTEDVVVDNLEFGAAFDSPISLPTGSSIGIALAHKIDPALREDLTGPSPWMMSPLLCAMNRLRARPLPAGRGLGEWEYGGEQRLEEDSEDVLPPNMIKIARDEGKRRSYFNSKQARQETVLSKDKMYEFEFLSSLVDFTKFEVSLGFRVGVKSYLNDQPVRFEARLKSTGEVVFGILFDGSQLDA